ncbi:hypothetical protein E2986_13002 [Frieseomelitta varia]|uniref:Uncharacterized protein n=1 Tax=Frieseomelitta varia TaxID=561572 RepID=A0A833VPP3_9HYME|nr:hypothetical protein E2986_13002 [Frieseomelitta varia]
MLPNFILKVEYRKYLKVKSHRQWRMVPRHLALRIKNLNECMTNVKLGPREVIPKKTRTRALTSTSTYTA